MATATISQSIFVPGPDLGICNRNDGSRTPIDIDDDEYEDDGLGGAPSALVPVGVDSPTKRAKTDVLASGTLIGQINLVHLIQSTIQDSVQSSLLPMQHTVQALADKSVLHEKCLDSQGQRLERVERALGSQEAALHDMDLQHSRRLDSFQEVE